MTTTTSEPSAHGLREGRPRAAPPRVRKRPTRFHHDFETYSDLDLKKVGAWNYSQHPSTEPLMLGYAFDDDDVKQWVPEEGQLMPAEVEDAMLDDRITKLAWNAGFEWSIWTHCLGIKTPWRAWRDPMVLAMTCSFPGKLERAGDALGLSEEYLKRSGGTLLMNWFSKKRAATKTLPERRVYWYQKYDKWLEYLEYNRFDVIAERKIWKMLRKFDLPWWEWEVWELDREINNHGIPINMELVENARRVRDDLIDGYMEEMKDLTGLDNPNSSQQLLPWLQDRGYVFTDLKKGHIARALERLEEEGEGDSDLAEVLRLRSYVSKTSVKKFDALATHTDPEGFIHDVFQFAGAQRTWRWAGRVYQAQNLAKPAKEHEGLEWETVESRGGKKVKKVCGGTQIEIVRTVQTCTARQLRKEFENPIQVLSGCVRPVVQAPEGMIFIDLDWNAIENRVLGWMADDRKILRVFRNGLDPYVDFATHIFGKSYKEIAAEVSAGNKSKRTVAKPGVLGCGYMLGAGHEYENTQTGEIEATGLLGYAWNMGVKLTPAQSELSVKVWRKTYTRAVEFWWEISRAAMKCVRTGRETHAGPIGFDMKGPFLRMILPSGRCLHYFRPKILPWRMPWGDYKDSLTYEGLNEKGQWTRISTHPGKLTENADQAIARDILAEGLLECDARGIITPMHVHDQIVALVPERGAENRLIELQECMSQSPRWGKTLPLAAEGHLSKWFVKD